VTRLKLSLRSSAENTPSDHSPLSKIAPKSAPSQTISLPSDKSFETNPDIIDTPLSENTNIQQKEENDTKKEDNIDKDIETEIINTQKKIDFVKTASFWTRMKSEFKKHKRDHNFHLKHIQELEWKIDHIKNRNSPPRCLVCGATNISSIDVRYLDYYHPGPAKKLMGFTHPNCGGKLWLIRDPIRWNIKFTPQVYDIEGNRISSPK